jgi:hypothetical protein
MAWIDCAASTLAADNALHAGAVVEFVRNNLVWTQGQSGYDVQTFHHSTYEIYHNLSTTDSWERFEQFRPAVLPARPDDGNDWRQIRITAEGKIVDPAKPATVRIYAGNTWKRYEPDATGGYTDWSSYGEICFSSSTYTLASCTLSPAGIGQVRPENWSAAMPSVVQVVFVNAIVSSGAAQKVSMRAPRFDEVPA